MDSGIVISLILGGASVISSICFGIIPNVRKERIYKLEQQRDRLFRDIRLFHEIEDELLNIIEQGGQNKIGVQKQVRKVISDRYGDTLSDYSKPSIYKKNIK